MVTPWGRNIDWVYHYSIKLCFGRSVYLLLIYSSLYIPPALWATQPAHRLLRIFRFLNKSVVIVLHYTPSNGRMIIWKKRRMKYPWPNLNSYRGILCEISRLTAKRLNKNFGLPDRANYICCYLLLLMQVLPSLSTILLASSGLKIFFVIKELGMCTGLYHCRLYVRSGRLWLNEKRFVT